MPDLLPRVHTLLAPLAQNEGQNATAISYLTAHRHSGPDMALPGTSNPFLYAVVQGSVRLHSPAAWVDVAAGDFVISAMHGAMVAQTLHASPQKPVLALAAEFCVDDIIAVMLDIDGDFPEKLLDTTATPSTAPLHSPKVLTVLLRLLAMQDQPAELAFMMKHLKREMIFDVIMSPCGKQFIENAINIQQSGDIYHVNSWIKQNFRQDFSVKELADHTNMSISSFHQKFKSAVGMGPIQCQKKLRLNEARRLMLDSAMNVTDAAMEVGYESLSQFTRDYRRMFGRAPQKDILEIREGIIKFQAN